MEDQKKELNLPQQEMAAATALVSDEFISNFKSIYYILNASPDTQMQVFNEDRLISLDDIYNLNDRVDAKLKTHNMIINSASVYISFDDGKGRTYENWAEFARTNWNIGSTTKLVNLEWDFFITLPGYQIPQRHSLKVRIGSTLRPDEYFKIMLESENDSQVDSLTANVVCRVDFINSVICDELLNLVKDWYQTLQKQTENSKIGRFYEKNASRISQFIDALFPISTIMFIYVWTSSYIDRNSSIEFFSSDKLNDTLLWFTVSLVIVLSTKYIGKIFASITFKKARSYEEVSHIYITKADNNRRQEAFHKNKSITRDISINIIASVIFALLSFVIGLMF